MNNFCKNLIIYTLIYCLSSFNFNAFCMNKSSDVTERSRLINSKKQDIIIDIRSIKETQKTKAKIRLIDKLDFFEFFPIAVWQEIASHLEYNDKALVYFLAPRIGIIDKNGKIDKEKINKIAHGIHDYYLAPIKKNSNFGELEKFLQNSSSFFSYYRHKDTKFLMHDLISKKYLDYSRLYLSRIESDYCKLIKSLNFKNKLKRKLLHVQPAEISLFWQDVYKSRMLDEFARSGQLNWRSLSEEKLVKINFIMFKLLKIFKQQHCKFFVNPKIYWSFIFIFGVFCLVNAVLFYYYCDFEQNHLLEQIFFGLTMFFFLNYVLIFTELDPEYEHFSRENLWNCDLMELYGSARVEWKRRFANNS